MLCLNLRINDLGGFWRNIFGISKEICWWCGGRGNRSGLSNVVAAKLNLLDEKNLLYYKQQSDIAARELCFEKNSKIILYLIDNVIGDH